MTDKLIPPHKLILYHLIPCKACSEKKCLKVKFRKDPTNTFGLGIAFVQCLKCKAECSYTDYYVTLERRKELWAELNSL